MLAWIILILLAAVEVGAFTWWLRKEYYPVFFNGWAGLIYIAILTADCIVAWLVSTLLTPGGSAALAWLSVIGVGLVVAVLAMTLFFKWVVGSDMNDITR